MDSQGSSVFVYLFLALLALSVVLIVWMFVSLVRSELEDERRKLIVGKGVHLDPHRHGGGEPDRGHRGWRRSSPTGSRWRPLSGWWWRPLMYAIFLGWFKHKYGG